jgi:DNA-binding transcriptional LysR family regulator
MKSIDLSKIDLNLLVAFEALLEEQSVTAAAQRLNLGQPAMSAALNRLRLLFQDELLIRVGKEMQPTSKALELAPGILAALQQVRQTLENHQVFDPMSSQRILTMGSPDYTSYVLIPALLEFCAENAPNLNFRFREYQKDQIRELLEQGEMDLALGVFPTPPQRIHCSALFQEHFVGIARKGHRAIMNGAISVETFAKLPHALVTLRRDATGEIDKALARHHLQRRVAITLPHMLVLPTIIATSDTVAAVPYRIAKKLTQLYNLQIFTLPVETAPWTVSLLWSRLSGKDAANSWLRQTLEMLCESI